MGYPVITVLNILKINKSTYYYAIAHKETKKIENSGRPIPGYSYNQQQRKIFDGQIKEWICDLIEGDAFVYGYRKLTVALKQEYSLIINKKKVYRLCKKWGYCDHSAR